jgi:channel protein, hemolysin III family
MLLKLKDPGSSITHFIAAIITLIAGIALIIQANNTGHIVHLVAMFIFIISMFLLYTASTLYHSIKCSAKIHLRLKKFDHMMISVLIAGTYTPICLIVLDKKLGIIYLLLIWSIAIIGILIKAFWVTCPRIFSSILYIAMGWLCVFAFSPLIEKLPLIAFLLLIGGGVIYTIGGIIYALKLPIFNAKHKYFGSHEIFHLFVMGGSVCHFMLMYIYLVNM